MLYRLSKSLDLMRKGEINHWQALERVAIHKCDNMEELLHSSFLHINKLE